MLSCIVKRLHQDTGRFWAAGLSGWLGKVELTDLKGPGHCLFLNSRKSFQALNTEKTVTHSEGFSTLTLLTALRMRKQ